MYVSWPTQMVNAATPLSKAMEYETIPAEMPVAPSTPETLIYDGYLRNIQTLFSLLPIKYQRFIGNLPSIQLTLTIKHSRNLNNKK